MKRIARILLIMTISLILFPGITEATKSMLSFPSGSEDYILYARTFLPSITLPSLKVIDLRVSGILYANETRITNTTVIDMNVTRNMYVAGNLTTNFTDIIYNLSVRGQSMFYGRIGLGGGGIPPTCGFDMGSNSICNIITIESGVGTSQALRLLGRGGITYIADSNNDQGAVSHHWYFNSEVSANKEMELRESESLWVKYDIIANSINGSFNWTPGDDWNTFDGSVLTFNESKLDIVYYNASSVDVYAGTIDDGDVESTWVFGGESLNVSEANAEPGLDLRINFTGVSDFNQIILRYRTSPDKDHETNIELWDFVNGKWEDHDFYIESEHWDNPYMPIWDSSLHVGTGAYAGQVWMRIYIENRGKSTHTHYYDFAQLSLGIGTFASNEADPLSYHKNRNIDAGNYNATVSWLIAEILNASNTTTNELTITAPPGQSYVFTQRSAGGADFILALQSQTSGDSFFLDFFTKDGDGTDNIAYTLWGKGRPDDLSVYEGLTNTYSVSDREFQIYSFAGGAGAENLPINLYAGIANEDQLILEPDGSVSVANNMSIGGGLSAATFNGMGIDTSNPFAIALKTSGGNDFGVILNNPTTWTITFDSGSDLRVSGDTSLNQPLLTTSDPIFDDMDLTGTLTVPIINLTDKAFVDDYVYGKGGSTAKAFMRLSDGTGSSISWGPNRWYAGGSQLKASVGNKEKMEVTSVGVRIGGTTENPTYTLDVMSNVSNVSGRFQANIVVQDVIYASNPFDVSKLAGKSPLDYANPPDYYKNPDGSLNHSKKLSYVSWEAPDGLRPETRLVEMLILNETSGKPYAIIVNETYYPYNKTFEGYSSETDNWLQEYQIYKLTQENIMLTQTIQDLIKRIEVLEKGEEGGMIWTNPFQL